MEVREHDLILADPRHLGGQRLLDLEDHVALREDLVGPVHDPGSRVLVSVVGVARPFARAVLDPDLVSILDEDLGPGRPERDPVLVRLDLPRNPYPHPGLRRMRSGSVAGGLAVPAPAAATAATTSAAPVASSAIPAAPPLAVSPILARLRLHVSLRLVQQRLAAQLHAPLIVDADQLDAHDLALLHHVLDLLDAAILELGDVHQAVAAGKDLHEGTERGDALDRPLIDPADLGLLDDRLDPAQSFLTARSLDGRDGDHAGVVDVDLRPRLLLHRADDLSARADDVADLVLGHRDRQDARSPAAERLARSRKDLVHLVEDVHPANARLLNGAAEYLERHPLDLDVHLEPGDPVARARDLEVHVAEEVLDAHDVGQHHDLIPLLDEPHRDPGAGLPDRNARVHHRQRSGAHGRHRGRPVGFQDVGDDADRVRELLVGREHALERALGQRAMPNLAPAGEETTDLAHRERRKVVVEHELLIPLGIQVVDHLLILPCAERDCAQRLRAPAREQRRSVSARQDSDLDLDRPDVLRPATVGSHALLDDLQAHDGLLGRLERVLDEARPLPVRVP